MKNIFLVLIIVAFLFFDTLQITILSVNVKLYHLFIPFVLLYFFTYRKIAKIKIYEINYLFLYIYLIFTIIYAIDLLLACRLVLLEILLIITYIYFRCEVSKYSLLELEKKILLIGEIYIIGSLAFYLIGIFSSYYSLIPNGEAYLGIMKESAFPRLRGFAESPNSYILNGLFFLVFFIHSKNYKFISLSILNLVLTFSTTGIIILAAIFLIQVVYSKQYLKIFKFSVIFTGVFFYIYYHFILQNEMIMKMVEIRLERNKSGTNRIPLWNYSLNLISENPIFGYGINQTRLLLKTNEGLNSLHNTYLEVLLTSGIVGLVLYLTFLILIFILSLKISFYMKEPRLIMLFVILVISSLSNNTLHIGYLIIYLVVFFQYQTKYANPININ